MLRPCGIVALLTDFGTRDPYVGSMKGAVLAVHPDAKIVDITHDVRPQEVLGARLVLEASVGAFPAGTVFVAVVDPGVGTKRAILCAESGPHVFLAPDNGLLSFLPARARFRRVTNRRLMRPEISATFHGRDIFAPVAGHLSKGLPPDRVGPEVRRIHRLALPGPKVGRDGVIEGLILHDDAFGNLITNIPGRMLRNRRGLVVRLFEREDVPMVRTYGDARPGDTVALVGSTGRLEIAVVGGSAASRFALGAKFDVRVGPSRNLPPEQALRDAVLVIETNLDNVSGETLGWLQERLFAQGALDVYTTPIQMKKNRPGVTLSVLAPIELGDRIERFLLLESPTFGVRRTFAFRSKLDRVDRTVATRYGRIRCKVGFLAERPVRAAPEYEDVRMAALRHRVPLETVHRAALRAAEALLGPTR